MNVTEKISKVATHAGWTPKLFEAGSRLVGIYTRDDQMLCIRYKLYGAAVNYICRYYGKDPASGINWGIESAHVKARTELPADVHSYNISRIFEGADKKRQVLAYLRDSAV